MSAADIQKLRKKFILIAMASIFIVMAFIGTVINVISYTVSVSAIRRSLNGLIAQDDPRNLTAVDSSPSFSDLFAPEYSHNHYFMFIYDSGTEVAVKTNSSDDTETESVREYASNVISGKREFGRKGNYYYLKVDENEMTKVVFLNCASEISLFYRIIVLTVFTCFLALLITFILVYRFSAKAIQPEIENNRRQKEFITNAGHELKTPLAVIRANTELIEMTGGESEWTKSTLAQVDRMDGLIKNLVLIAKSQEQEKKKDLTEIDLSSAVEQAVDTFETLALKKEKKLVKKIDKDMKMLADEGSIRQLTTLLVDNAIKYCDENGTIEVSLAPAPKGKGAQLAVSNDYAAGKDVNYNLFFDRFYREDKSHNIDKGGYGIGLSIAQDICKQYDGNIKVRWDNGVITFVCLLK